MTHSLKSCSHQRLELQQNRESDESHFLYSTHQFHFLTMITFALSTLASAIFIGGLAQCDRKVQRCGALASNALKIWLTFLLSSVVWSFVGWPLGVLALFLGTMITALDWLESAFKCKGR